MANFIPQWDLVSDGTDINEGGEINLSLQLSTNDLNNPEYVLNAGQYLNVEIKITPEGDTFEERDFIIKAGEFSTELSVIDNYTGILSANLETTSFTSDTQNVYYINVFCVDDGVWDDPESLTFELTGVSVVTEQEGIIVDKHESGVIGVNTVTVNYKAQREVWVTPGLTTHGDNLYTIGSISFGAESRLFVQAYGISTGLVEPEVFLPAYEILPITEDEMPDEHITGSGTIIVPNPDSTNTEEIQLLIKDSIGNMVDIGLRFNTNNGQFLQTLFYDSDPVDAYFKVRIVPIDYYNDPMYYNGKRFRAYQTWLSNDISNIHDTPLENHIYQLKNSATYPYIVSQSEFEGNTVLNFSTDIWEDLGEYNEDLGTDIVGNERIFRIVLNDISSSNLIYEVPNDLGEIHVGEYFGHTVYPRIIASGDDLITYEIADSSPDDITKYNIDLSADGYLIGTAFAKSSDFSANDDIVLNFDVTASSKTGKSITNRFTLRIIRGLSENYIQCNLMPSLTLERKWFEMISSPLFADAPFYRQSDYNYGLRKIPKLLLKENVVDNSKWTDIEDAMKRIRSNIVNDTVPTPNGVFNLVLGNFKLKTAYDNNGRPLYDVLYREVHPFGTTVRVSINPYDYYDYDINKISEIYGLRENIVSVLGEDIENLSTDPSDMANRGISVDAIDGLSSAMRDTVPRFMNHNHISEMYFPCIVVGYFEPGKGEEVFNSLVQNNEHIKLVNTVFSINTVEFLYFGNTNSKYRQEKFVCSLPTESLNN